MRMLKHFSSIGSVIQGALARGYELNLADEAMGCIR
jgi:hypothetical protein